MRLNISQALCFSILSFFSINAFAIEDSLENRTHQFERFQATQPTDDTEVNDFIRQTIKSTLQNSFNQDANQGGVEYKKFVDYITENSTTLLSNKSLQAKIDKEVYTTLFTADEIQGIADFFESPAGRSYRNKSLAMMQMSMEKARQYMANNGGKPSIGQIINNYIASHPELVKEMFPSKNK